MDLIAVASDWLSTGQWWLKLTLVGAATAGLAWTQVRPLLLDVFGRTDSIKRRVETLKVLYEISALKTAAGQPADDETVKKWNQAVRGVEFDLVRDLGEDGVTRLNRKMKVLIARGGLWLTGVLVTVGVQWLLAHAAKMIADSIWFMLLVALFVGYQVCTTLFSAISFYASMALFKGDRRLRDHLFNHMTTAMDCFYVIELSAVCIRGIWLLKGQ